MQWLLTLSFLFLSANGYSQLFQQEFGSSTLLPDYINTTAPNNGQWNAIASSNNSILPITISGNALSFAKSGAAIAHFVRTTDFSPIPPSVMYRFELTVSGNNTATTTAGNMQIGSGFVASSFLPQPIANVHSRFGINISPTPGNFSIRNIQAGFNSAEFSGPQVVLWVVNNSGGVLNYRSPAGTQETIGNDLWDLWIGATLVFSDILDATPANNLANIYFTYDDGIATMSFDNFLVDPVPDIPISQPATSVNAFAFVANWTPVSGNTGYRIDVATDAAFANILPAYNNLYISGSSSSSLTIGGLTPGGTYFYRVRAASQYTVDEYQGGNSLVQSVVLAALPLTLLKFYVQKDSNDQPELHWTTTGEADLGHFLIQKSANGIDFDSIGAVRATNTPDATQNYSFTDISSVNIISFYRLKIIAIDSSYRYSKIIVLRNVIKGIKLLQNPVRNTLQVLHPGFAGDASALIYSISGKMLLSKKLNTLPGVSNIDITSFLPGVYNLKIVSGSTEKSTTLFIKVP